MTERIIGVLASGRGSNLQAIIDNIGAGLLPVRIGVVISDNPAAYALKRAQAADVPCCLINRQDFSNRDDFEQAMCEKLLEYRVELVVMAGFMRMLGPLFVNRWPLRIMNIHPSLLPGFPGLNAQAQAVRYGAKVSGCTVHFVDEGMDTGQVIIQRTVNVTDNDTPDSLAERILIEEHIAYTEAISLWAQDRLAVNGRVVTIKNN